MAWRFRAIDATLSPWPRRLDGVEAHSHPLRTQAFPKLIQEEMDRLADEQMLKLKE